MMVDKVKTNFDSHKNALFISYVDVLDILIFCPFTLIRQALVRNLPGLP